MAEANDGWRWPHFSPAEMQCRHCRQSAMNGAFMDRLQALRLVFGTPMVISSGYRCAIHNAAIGAGPHSAHVQGRAVDVSIYGKQALVLIDYARDCGFTGIGVQQKFNLPLNRRFIHVDDMPDGPGRPRPHLWSY